MAAAVLMENVAQDAAFPIFWGVGFHDDREG
jgi:hypothetical protein